MRHAIRTKTRLWRYRFTYEDCSVMVLWPGGGDLWGKWFMSRQVPQRDMSVVLALKGDSAGSFFPRGTCRPLYGSVLALYPRASERALGIARSSSSTIPLFWAASSHICRNPKRRSSSKHDFITSYILTTKEDRSHFARVR